MRRTLGVLTLVAAAGVAGALAYGSFTTERDFVRLVAAGDAAAAAGDPFQALEAYSGSLALVPDAVAPYLKRGLIYREQGQAEAALRDWRRAAELDPSGTRPLEWLGDLSLSMDRADRAVDYYQRFLSIDDTAARVHYKLGMARYRAGTPQDAVAALDLALRLDPGHFDARYLLGLCQRDLVQLPAARATLERLVSESPAASGPREALAEVYTGLGEPARAIDQLEALATLEPARPERLVAVGLAQARAGRETQAILTLSRVVERFPTLPLGYASLGHAWLRQAERQRDSVALLKAVEALTVAATYPSSSSAALSDLGRALTLSGDLPAAERNLRQAVTRLPVMPEAFLRLAAVTEQQRRYTEARDALLQYAALVGDREPLAPVASRIAALSTRIGEPLTAVRWLDQVIEELGPSVSLLAQLADAAWRGGDTTRARQAAAEALALAPGDVTVAALVRRVASDPVRALPRRPDN
jgi:tetratricopeptide (TPR) repeat protein